MKTLTNLTILAGALWMSASPALAASPVRRVEKPIEGRYIVVLRDDSVRPHGADLRDARPSVRDLARDLAGRERGRAHREYAAALRGFAFEGDADAAARLAADPRVAYVSEDGWVEAAGQPTPPSWGLDRIDQRPRALDGMYEYYADGDLVDVYVVDSGIRSTHVEFGGRVDLGRSFSAIDDGWGTEDCLGHGTHVAGLIGGATYGVAKNVTLHPVRVLDCTGRGTISQIVAGIDWVTAQYTGTTTSDGGSGGGGKGGGKGGKNALTFSTSTWSSARQGGGDSGTAAASAPRAVVNLSLATTWTSALDDAVANSIAAGLVYVVAAGNGGEDACYVSPARVPGAITVGATDSYDARTATSNFGSCLDLFAPGQAVVSSWARSDTDAVAMSGTSMAAPHVAGTAALLLSINPDLSPADVATLIRSAATQGAVTGAGPGSPAGLLFAPFTGWGMDMTPYAEFTASCLSANCTFDASPSADDRGLLSYSWDLDAGKTASGESVSVRYGRRAPEQVLVRLTVTDSVGQQSTIEKWVRTAY